jgi:hypothetical protein
MPVGDRYRGTGTRPPAAGARAQMPLGPAAQDELEPRSVSESLVSGWPRPEPWPLAGRRMPLSNPALCSGVNLKNLSHWPRPHALQCSPCTPLSGICWNPFYFSKWLGDRGTKANPLALEDRIDPEEGRPEAWRYGRGNADRTCSIGRKKGLDNDEKGVGTDA